MSEPDKARALVLLNLGGPENLEEVRPFCLGSRSKRSMSSSRRARFMAPWKPPSRSMHWPPVRFGHSMVSPGT